MTRILSIADTILKLPDFRWSLERYHAAIEAGILTEYDKVEYPSNRSDHKYYLTM